MIEPLYFYWTKQRGNVFAATHDETGKGLPADLKEWIPIPPFAIDKAGKLDSFPREKANEEIKKLGYFLFYANVTFVDVRPA